MPVVPSKCVAKIEFYQSHVAQWASNAESIGTTPGAVSALATLTEAARDAFKEQQEIQNAAKAATLKLQTAVDAMGTAGASIMKQIRAKGGEAGNGVYSLASIPAPARPSPIGAPGKPSDFKIKLHQDGSLLLKWKCPNPAGAVGTIYQLYRRIGNSSDEKFAYLGNSGQRKFVDTTLPAGAAQVTYQIQAVRSTRSGPFAQFNVNFGGVPVMPSLTRKTPVTQVAA